MGKIFMFKHDKIMLNIIYGEIKMKIIDLRSDTVTKPSSGMLHAMMNAPVGDDVFGEDPTVNLLEQQIAEQSGMAAAVFVTATSSRSTLPLST